MIESPPCGMIAAQGNSYLVGTIIWTPGCVEIVPRKGILDAHLEVLRAIGAQVWCGRVEQLGGWQFHPGMGWYADVKVARPQGLGRLRASSSWTCSGGVDTVVPTAGSTLPSAR